jgi:hypothetical protein
LSKTLILLITISIALLGFRFNRKLLLVFVVSIIPNFIFSIGGAEKDSFSTHYHALWLPYFVFLFSTILSNAVLLIKKSRKIKAKKISLGITLIILVIWINIGYFISFDFKWASVKININSNYILARKILIPNKEHLETLESNKQTKNFIVGRIPKNSNARVSAPEWLMPALVNRGITNVYAYPLAAGSSKYVFAETVKVNGIVEPTVFPWFYGPEVGGNIGMCVERKLDLPNSKKEIIDSQVLGLWYFRTNYVDR